MNKIIGTGMTISIGNMCAIELNQKLNKKIIPNIVGRGIDEKEQIEKKINLEPILRAIQIGFN